MLFKRSRLIFQKLNKTRHDCIEVIMNSNCQQKMTKIIDAPLPSHSHLLRSIYQIEIDRTQEVEWKWLVLPDGSRVVIDYQIISTDSAQT